ncbi:unnamed protein product [Mucor hiemalis]
MANCFQYEDHELQNKALDIIPLQRLYEEAEVELEDRGGSLEDCVIRRLLHWFKNDFFTWVDNAPCDFCQSADTTSSGYDKPNSDDLFMERMWWKRIDVHIVLKLLIPSLQLSKQVIGNKAG